MKDYTIESLIHEIIWLHVQQSGPYQIYLNCIININYKEEPGRLFKIFGKTVGMHQWI